MVDGLAIGLVYVFMAAGFNLILSVTNVFFIAFGMFYVLGAYFTWDFVQLGVPFFASVVIATIITAFGGALVDMVLFRRIRKSQQSLLKALIASIMLFTIVQQLIMIAFGTEARGIRPIFPGHWKVAGVIIAYDRAAMICVSLVVLIALQLLLHKSRLGRGMRAMSISPEVADLHGVNPPRMGTATFAVGLGLAGFAGGLMAPLFSVSLDMAQSGFIVLLIIMIGGIGSMVGSILSGILLGLIVSFSQFFVSAGVGQMIFFAIVALFFFVRPGGIFGKPQEDPPGEVGYLTQVKRRLSGWQRPVAIGLGLLVVLALPPIIRDPYWVHVLILVVVYAVFGMTFNFGMRAGMINVAGAAFWGVGAYSTALLMTKTGLNYWEALPLTLLISLAIALCLGTIVCRFAGILGMMFSIVFASLIPLVFNTFGFFGKAKGISNLQGRRVHRADTLLLSHLLLLSADSALYRMHPHHARLQQGMDGQSLVEPRQQSPAVAVGGSQPLPLPAHQLRGHVDDPGVSRDLLRELPGCGPAQRLQRICGRRLSNLRVLGRPQLLRVGLGGRSPRHRPPARSAAGDG